MKKMNVTNCTYEASALAIVRAETLGHACETAGGCVRGGVSVMEMSYMLNSAGDIVQDLSEKYGDAPYAGVGTVLGVETARHTVLRGAAFIIAPDYDEKVAKMCNRYQIPYAPGYITITECADALSSGVISVKTLPIPDFCGPRPVKVFKTPAPDMPTLVSGGINLGNLITRLENGVNVYRFGGLLTKGSSEDIVANAAKVYEIITSFCHSK